MMPVYMEFADKLHALKEYSDYQFVVAVFNGVEDYGVFVNLFGEVDGLCHVSRLAWDYVEDASKVCQVGDTLKVVVIGLDEKGKVKVSHREFEEKPEGYVERPERPEHHGGPRPHGNGGPRPHGKPNGGRGGRH